MQIDLKELRVNITQDENAFGYKYMSLDKAFDNIIKQFQGLKAKQAFDYERTFRGYEQTLKETPLDLSSMNNQKLQGVILEWYERVYELADKDDYYTIAWSVSRLREIIKERKLVAKEWNTKELYELIDEGTVGDVRAVKSEPVILVHTESLRSTFIADGNKRVTYAYQNKQPTIMAYDLPSKVHMEAMACEYMKKIYKIHFNVNLIACYMLGLYNKAELMAGLYKI